MPSIKKIGQKYSGHGHVFMSVAKSAPVPVGTGLLQNDWFSGEVLGFPGVQAEVFKEHPQLILTRGTDCCL